MKLSPTLQPTPSVSANGTAAIANGRGLPTAFDTDMKGADLDALMRFNETLPQPAKVKSKQPKKPGEEEALGETSEVVSDTPEWLASDTQEWQVAQAEIGAGAAASGASAGAASGGAGAAGAAGAAAGAGSAVAIVSPLAFSPALLLAGGGGDNDAPVIDENTSSLKGSVTENLDTDGLLKEVQIVSTGQVKFRDPDAGDTPVASVVSANATLAYVADGEVSASPLPANLDADALKAAFSITEAGAWTFDASELNLEELGEGDTITLTYTVTVTDDFGATDTTPVVITIHGANDAPVLTAGLKEDGITKVYLEVNAESNQETTCPELSATDIDVGETDTLTYHFLVDGVRKNVSDNGLFSIDADTGRISLTEAGALEAGVANYDLACASYTVDVVAFDGMVNSNVETIRIERTLPDVQPGGTDTLYSLWSMLATGEDFPYTGEGDRVSFTGGEDQHVTLTIDDTDNFSVYTDEDDKEHQHSFDVLNLEIVGAAEEFSVERGHHDHDRDDLKIRLEYSESKSFQSGDYKAVELVVTNHYAAAGEGNGSIEYIHFGAGSSFAGYQLSSDADEVLEACDMSYFPENGSYRIANQAATSHGETLEGTVCNDLIAGSSAFKEHLSGGNGNDLLFAAGGCDTLEGGAGNDLLVLDGDEHGHDEHGRIVFAAAGDNGSDTVVNFDKHHKILLSTDGLSTEAFTREDDPLSTNMVEEVALESGEDASVLVFNDDEAGLAAVIALDVDVDSSFNLHTWITTLGAQSNITGIQVKEGASQYFLVEDADGNNTHLYFASDKTGDGATDVGLLTVDEFTHMAQFTDTGVDAFGEFNNSFNVLFA